MVTKSIIDRILILAAVVCAAGLAWQLTVLLTAKGQGSAIHKADTIVQPAPTSVAASAPIAPKPPDEPSVRVVYPPEQGLPAPKTTAKASDGPVTAPAVAGSPSPAVPAAALQPQAAPFAVPSALATAAVPAAAGPAVAPAAPTPAPASAPAPAADPAPTAAAAASVAATPPAAEATAGAPAATAAAASLDVQPEPARWSPEATGAGADQTQTTAPASAAASQPEAPSPAAPAPSRTVASLGPPHAAAASTAPARHASSGGININSASVDALDHLRGGGHIGQAIARHRPYRSIEDLVKKRVLRRDTYEQIKHQIATQ